MPEFTLRHKASEATPGVTVTRCLKSQLVMVLYGIQVIRIRKDL